MPFYSGGAGDAGHSVPELRQLYLNVTFYSFHRHVADVAVAVCTAQDARFVRETGLPWFEIIQEHCHVNATSEKTGQEYDKYKPSLLGVLTSRAAQHRFETGKWKHRFLLYTESDQVLYLRSLAGLLSLTGSNKYVAPHRILPLPTAETFPRTQKKLSAMDRFAQMVCRVGNYFMHKFRVKKNYSFNAQIRPSQELKRNGRPVTAFVDEFSTSCCFDRGECKSRNHWKSWLKTPHEFDLMSVDGSFPVVSGEGNFLRMSLRPCKMQPQLTTCP